LRIADFGLRNNNSNLFGRGDAETRGREHKELNIFATGITEGTEKII